MSMRSEQSSPWNDIEAVLDQVRVEEEAELAVLEASGQLDEPDEDEFSWDGFPWDAFPWEERAWGDFSLNDLWVDEVTFRSM